jgi:hypothetical protein
MRFFTLRTLWKKPETLRILMVQRRAAGIVRLGASGLVRKAVVKAGARDVRKDVGMGAGGVGGMGGIGIVDRVRRCRLGRTRRWKRLGVLLLAAMPL